LIAWIDENRKLSSVVLMTIYEKNSRYDIRASSNGEELFIQILQS